MKIGIAGFGIMGANHAREIAQNGAFELVAIYDICAPNAQNTVSTPFFSDIDAFLDANLDTAIISTPTNTHLTLARALAPHIKTLLIEKPLAANLAEIEKIAALALKHKNRVAVGFSERFNPSIIALKNALQNERIISIDIRRFSPYPARIRDVGIVEDLAVHDIDLAMFLGDCDMQKSTILTRQVREKDDCAMIILQSERIIANIHESWHAREKMRNVVVICKDNFYEADLLRFTLKKNREKLNVAQDSPLKNEHNALKNLATSGDFSNLATIESARKVQCILEDFT